MSVGTILRDRREALSLDLPELSEYLRIKQVFLEAIENEDFRDLPGGTYATGFVKTYAKALGLDHDAVTDAFRVEQAEAARKAPLTVRSPIKDSRIPTVGITTLAVVLLAGGWIAWSYVGNRPAQHAETVPELPDRLKQQAAEAQAIPVVPVVGPAAPGPVQPTLSSTADGPDRAPSPGQMAGPVPTGTMPGTATLATPAAPAKPVVPITMAFSASSDGEPDEAENDTDQPGDGPNMRTAPATENGPGTAYGTPAGAGQAELHALADSWIQVRDGNRTVVYAGILHKGDVYRAPSGQGYTFVSGNAGGVSLDGTTPLGASGHVIRNVALDGQPAKHP